jgi:SSS family solute:Na+ symporter
LVVIVPAIIGAFYWKRGTAAGALASIVIGGLVVIGLYVSGAKPLGLPAGIWALPVAVVLFVVVSLMTKSNRESAAEFMRTAGTATSTGVSSSADVSSGVSPDSRI